MPGKSTVRSGKMGISTVDDLRGLAPIIVSERAKGHRDQDSSNHFRPGKRQCLDHNVFERAILIEREALHTN